ncbi:hypothetical protein [Cupriavidus lacunae]|nr:hypothetical protein [Cupriavidus lacunae]
MCSLLRAVRSRNESVDAIRARIVPELKAAAVELMVLLRDVGSEA